MKVKLPYDPVGRQFVCLYVIIQVTLPMHLALVSIKAHLEGYEEAEDGPRMDKWASFDRAQAFCPDRFD